MIENHNAVVLDPGVVLTLGVAQRQGDLLDDVAQFCGRVLPENSIYGLLHRERDRFFPDEAFADLFAKRHALTPPPESATATDRAGGLAGAPDCSTLELAPRLSPPIVRSALPAVNSSFTAFRRATWPTKRLKYAPGRPLAVRLGDLPFSAVTGRSLGLRIRQPEGRVATTMTGHEPISLAFAATNSGKVSKPLECKSASLSSPSVSVPLSDTWSCPRAIPGPCGLTSPAVWLPSHTSAWSTRSANSTNLCPRP